MTYDLQEETGRERIRLVMKHIPTMQAASLVVALVLSYSVRDIASRRNILAFLLSVSAAAAGHAVLYARFRKVSAAPFSAGSWRTAFLLLTLVLGAAWGASAFLIYPGGDPWVLAFFALVFASLSASATVSHSAVKWAPAAWVIPALLPYTVRCALSGRETESLLAFLIVVYAIAMLLYSFKHHGTIDASIALRFENLKLLEEIRRNEERFRNMFLRHGAVMLLLSQETGDIVDANPSAERFYGYPLPRLKRMNMRELNVPLSGDARQARMPLPPEGLGVSELSQRLAGGEIRIVEAHSSPIQVGERTLLFSILHDITDRERARAEKKNLQEQLQQAMKMEAIGRLAGGIAHDFNNILTVILGNIHLSRSKLPPSDPVARFLAEANQAGERAAALTQQLLAFSRKQIIEPKVLDLDLLIADMGRMLHRLIGENIELKTVSGREPGLVKVDPGQFEQILVNLAVNARDAMPDGGKLLIETANVDLDEEYCARHPYVRPGRFVMLAVTDTGHGMTEEVRKHAFEPFFTTKPEGHGTGLGLATTYGAVKQSGGSIEVHSEPGKGTTFKIYLPRVADGASKPGEPDSPTELPSGSGTVLLVEDEEVVRMLCSRILTDLGYQVLEAAGGEEAIAMATEFAGRIDLLMTDVVMPGMNGRVLADLLTRFRPETRVLFTSGYTDDEIVRHRVLDEGASFIGKPYSCASLAEKVRETLGKSPRLSGSPPSAPPEG